MDSRIQELFEAIRAACSTAAWSRGVDLARAGAVSGERDDGDEVALRVSTRGGLICPVVSLYPNDGDWDCDCGSREDGCEHAAAAVIALRRARKEGAGLPDSGRSGGRIGYRLSRTRLGLDLQRVVVEGDTSRPLTTSLAAVASGRVDGPRFAATQADLAVERTMGSRLRGAIPRGVMMTLLAQLAECNDVQLDGVPVRTSAERVGLCAVLEDDGDDFVLRAGRDRQVSESLGDNLVLCGDVVCATAESQLTGRELGLLKAGRRFTPDQVAELVNDVLPTLQVPLDVRTERLPRTVSTPPRLLVQIAREGDALSLLPTLVYGDPPLARVDGTRLVPLGGPVPLRDQAAERELVRRLQNELEVLPGRKLVLEGEAAVDMAGRLARFSGEICGEGLEAFHRTEALVAHFETDASGFELSFRSESPDGAAKPADPARVMRAWRRGDSLAPLEGGGFAPLPADWLERFGDRVADLLAAKADNDELPACAMPDLARLCDDLDQPCPPDAERLRRLVEGFSGIPEAPLPEDLTATLRPYQRHGVDWLCLLRDAGLGALLADDMGLGKTVQALCALRGRTLVVAPRSVIHNWVEEMQRFRPALRASVYHGPKRALDATADVTVTTYALMRLDVERLAGIEWDTVILDEAQMIKNASSQVARAAYRLRAGFRATLSGTPVENRLDELWSQFHFLNRGLLGSLRDFEERYAGPIANGESGSAERLRARIRPFLLRRLKSEVAPELPPRTDVVLHAVLRDDERRVYDAIRAATRNEVVAQLTTGRGALVALEALLRLRQACCHSALVPGQSAATSSKLELLVEFADEVVAEGHKALIFSQWTSLLDLIEPALRNANLDFGRLDGSTRDRAGVVARFQGPGGPPLLLVSLTAGGLGLNLTAADHVFILDPWWNPAVEDQAADRAHRIGQERPVMVYRLVAEDTVEERILALQQRKRELAAAALGEGDRAAALTREDLLALLE